MRIGVDARAAVEERAGRGTMVRELLRAWQADGRGHELVLYARERWPGIGGDGSARSGAGAGALRRPEAGASRLRWSEIRAPDPLWHGVVAWRASRECDVYLSTNSYLTAWFLRVPSAVVICDLVAWHPELAPQRRAGAIERATLPFAVRRAAALDCISHSTERDLVARFPAAAGKATTIELAADERFSGEGERRGGEPDAEGWRGGVEGRPYVLGVGTLEPRKNLPRLVEAFASLPTEVRGERVLALAGPPGWETDATIAAARRHADVVRPLGFVPDAELPALYRGADLFAYPSLYEGFGLPVLEAMRCGTPVLTSDRSSLPEVAGDAAVYVDPTDVGSIREGLTRALTDADMRRRLSAAGLERARGFSWARCAAETLDLLERIAGERAG
jgi:glycosyltransferase involved in cell wall biosynthesis